MTSQQQQLAGEVIWITGASSGIGYALALQLAQAGAKVIASARSEAGLQQLAAAHANIIPLVFDVSDTSAIAVARERLARINPYLDRVILNAGTCEYLDIASPDWSMMERVMAVNYLGAVNTLAVAMPLLQQSPARAHIVGVVSLATVVPFARAEAYGASKAALQYFLDALRVDLNAQQNAQQIDVTVINPGFVATPLTDKNDFAMPFLMEAEPAAARMLGAIIDRKRQYDFPRRLKWLLKALGSIPAVWNDVVAPRLSRH